MLFRAKQWLAGAGLRSAAAGILQTPPVMTPPGALTVISMVSHRDLHMYLLAAKTLLTRIGEGIPLVVNDGSLTDQDQAVIREHLPSATLMNLRDIDTGACQRGGTWERLVLILDLTRERYVIQMDSDTLTVGRINEVVSCYRQRRSFTLGTRMGLHFVDLQTTRELVGGSTSSHVQVMAERAMQTLPGAASLCYVRGSSGFAGFAPRSFSIARLEEFSRHMEAELGAKWREWGSEQVASNFVIANSASAVVLPHPKYACYDPQVAWEGVDFLHFVGTWRFHDQVYATRCRAVISCLEKSTDTCSLPAM